MRVQVLALALGVLGLLVVPTVATWAANDELVVTQDESSMEKVIESYLRDNYKLVMNEKYNDEQKTDMYLEVPYNAGAWPAFTVDIDTDGISKDKTGTITERGVLLFLHTAVTVPADKRAAVSQVLEDYNRKKIFCSAYVDQNGEIRLDWVLGVLPQGLPTEYVNDALTRLCSLWTGMYADVAAAMQ